MMFTKSLRDGVRRGEITCSVRIWMRPHVKVGGRYAMEEGEIEVDSVLPIQLDDVTPALARASGFKSIADLLQVAKHGRGESVYLVSFHYIPPGRAAVPTRTPVGARTARPRRAGTARRSAPSRR
jgi:ASCH domain-containing protein